MTREEKAEKLLVMFENGRLTTAGAISITTGEFECHEFDGAHFIETVEDMIKDDNYLE